MVAVTTVHWHLPVARASLLLVLGLAACTQAKTETTRICRGASCSDESTHAENVPPAAEQSPAAPGGEGYRGEKIESLESAAAEGDPDAAYKLGMVRQLGLAGTQKDPARAAALYRQAGAGGNADADFMLAQLYQFGVDGTDRNPGEAATLYRQAAKGGNANANYGLAQLYFEGQGVPRDPQRGVELLQSAAEGGNPEAAQNLGALYEDGSHVPRDPREAARWFEVAANAGVASAQTNLGLLYLKGQGVPQNGFDGMSWLRKAAENGDVKAQVTLGRLYLSGYDTVGQDLGEADRWITAAALQGDPEAKKLQEKVQALRANGGNDGSSYWRSQPFDFQRYYDHAYQGFHWMPYSYYYRKYTGYY
ncbi:MAG: tetratricopeptide repeat protein [Geminicoccaceae bacterium]